MRAAARKQKALDMIGLVGLSGKEDHYPYELSGGQQQRVGIARSLSTNPSLWLLDEPFSALDPLIREEMQDEILRLQKTLSKTAVFVTHDFNEAARVGDRIALLRKGQLVQTGSAAELILNPADSYVRAFTASAERSRISDSGKFHAAWRAGRFRRATRGSGYTPKSRGNISERGQRDRLRQFHG